MKTLFYWFILFHSYSVLSQNNINRSKNITLIGEAHFIKEKYYEIDTYIYDQIRDLKNGESITIYLELPYSFNYALERIHTKEGQKVFDDWYHHIYAKKSVEASFFWTDYKKSLMNFKQYAKENRLNIKFKAIDTERVLRRTAFILSQFRSNNTKVVDSLLNLPYVYNDLQTRSILTEYTKDLVNTTNSNYEKIFLENLIESISVNCTICKVRDEFMANQIDKSHSNKDSKSFAVVGLDHISNQPDFSNIGNYFRSKHVIDTTNYMSMYCILNNKNYKITRLGIISLYQDMRYSSMKVKKDYKNIMEENDFQIIESLLENKNVARFNTKDYEFSDKLNKNLEYLIVFKSSSYRY